jgi:uncharacterized protein
VTQSQSDPTLIAVCIAYSPSPRDVIEQQLEVPAGSTVQLAVAQAGLHARLVLDAGQCVNVGVWGRAVSLDTQLHAGDRVEIYRPLQVDPKVARRERFQQQGVKKSGLFAKRRPGAKPGY